MPSDDLSAVQAGVDVKVMLTRRLAEAFGDDSDIVDFDDLCDRIKAERGQAASCHVFECRNDRTADSPYCPAHTQITELLAAAPSPPVDRDGLIEIVATNQLRRYDEEFDASHLSWRDFESSAAEDVDALISAGVVAQPPAGDGVMRIADERRHAVAEKGFTAEHDDRHTHGELLDAARCYADQGRTWFPEFTYKWGIDAYSMHDQSWPWWSGDQQPDGWHPSTDPVENLAKAGQFIAAEIDRLLRARDSSREAGQP